MPKISVYDMTGKEVSQIELSDAVFGITPNQGGAAPGGCYLFGESAAGHPVPL